VTKEDDMSGIDGDGMGQVGGLERQRALMDMVVTLGHQTGHYAAVQDQRAAALAEAAQRRRLKEAGIASPQRWNAVALVGGWLEALVAGATGRVSVGRPAASPRDSLGPLEAIR
jgi:hypothetical protein